jgi:hypothetical protein
VEQEVVVMVLMMMAGVEEEGWTPQYTVQKWWDEMQAQVFPCV